MTYRTLAQAFAARVDETPRATAGLAGSETTTWADLRDLTARYMGKLAEAGVTVGDRVVVSMGRSIGLMAAVLAVHASGAVCVPIDPDDPAERRRTLYSLSGMRVCLVDEAADRAAPGRSLRLEADDRSGEAPAFAPAEVAPDAPAFLFFTSGSTGTPKGVILSHEAVLAGQSWLQARFCASTDDTMFLRSAISATNLVREVYWPVLSGAATAILPSGQHRDPVAQVRAMREHGVTVLLAVPSLLRAMTELDDLASCRRLRLVFSSSDMMPSDLPERLFGALGTGVALYNLYGLTEALYAGYFHCQPGVSYAGSVPVGQDAELRMLVLDDADVPVAEGEAGHLCLGGIGIASGYLDTPALSAERFVAAPRAEFDVPRMFRTGDLARRGAGGVVTLLGRSDDMVKVRGHRVETGEVAASLREVVGVEDAAVIGMDDGGGTRRLVAFLVTGEGRGLNATVLRDTLATRLPDYMIPAAFAKVSAIPLAHNGKVDVRSLRDSRVDYVELSSEYVAPRSPAESHIAEIWAEMLAMPKEDIGVLDNFFALGGDSIKGFLVAARLNREGFALAATQIFATPTIAEMAVAAADVGRSEPADLDDEDDAAAPDLASYGVFGWDSGSAASILHKIQ